MGSIQSRTELPDKKNFYILDYGYCRVWKRKVDSIEIMEEYPIFIESEERLKAFESLWPLRTNHHVYVNVYHFSHSQANNICGRAVRGFLFTERIPYRLSEFGNIKYPQIVCIMKSCIQGFKGLYQTFGRFCIRSTMIGFTQSFRVKIWCHTDFSEPEPQNPNCKNLLEMFTSLLNAVESTCEVLNYYCPRFSQFIAQNNYVYFSKDFDYLLKGLEDYASKLGISKVSKLINLKNCIKKPEGWEKFKAKNNYPKLLSSEIQITSETQGSLKNVSTSVNSLPNPSLFQRKQSEIPSLGLNKKFSSPSVANETSNRMLSKFQKQHNKIHHQSNPYIPSDTSRINIRNFNYQNIANKEEIRFWRSSQKTQQKIISGIPSVSRYHSPTQRIGNKQVSNQYFGQPLPNLKQLSRHESSENQNDCLARKSLDISTATRNRDKQTNSEFSLIEDLQMEATEINHNLNFHPR